MSGIKTHRAIGLALAFAGTAWCAPVAQALAASDTVPIDIGRPTGLALVGVALLGIGGVFRWAMSKPATRSATKVEAQEYRSGFRTGAAVATRTAPRDPVVIELRRVLAERQARQGHHVSVSAGSGMSSVETQRLQEKLHHRAATLRDRPSNQAKRRFIRSGVDVHGLARE